MFVTILMATHNRVNTLEEVLECYRRLVHPEPWKIVLVDNGSTDDTRKTVESFARDLPIKYVFEPRPGKTVALNTGLSEVEGDLIVFTDDDAPPCPEWLTLYRQAAQEHPDHDIFAGPVVPRWPSHPPSWVTENVAILTGAFAASNPGLKEGDLLDPGHVVGSNFAIRSELARKYRFNSEIGPKGTNYYCLGDETEFLARVTAAGHKTWWVEGAAVQHIIRSEQISKNWILERAVKLGRGGCFRDQQNSTGTTFWLGVPRWLFTKCGMYGLKMFRSAFLGTKAQFFASQFEFIRSYSVLSETLKMARARKRQ